MSFWKQPQDPGSQGFTFQAKRFPHTKGIPYIFVDLLTDLHLQKKKKNTSNFLRLEEYRLKPLTEQKVSIVSKLTQDPPEVRQVGAVGRAGVKNKHLPW